jgi:hypothetical protein
MALDDHTKALGKLSDQIGIAVAHLTYALDIARENDMSTQETELLALKNHLWDIRTELQAQYDAIRQAQEPSVPWCEEHQCQFVLFDDKPGEPEYYDCPECRREDAEQLGLI